MFFFFFSSRRRHTRLQGDWSSDVCSSDLSPRAIALRMGVDRLAIFQCCDLCAVLLRDLEALRQFAILWLDGSDPSDGVSRILSPYFVGTNIGLGAALLHSGISGDKF